MIYQKTTWVNNETPMNANNLNNIENGIENIVNNMLVGNTGYLKLDDGTLICYGKTDTFNINYGEGVNKDIQLPMEFIDTNYIVTCSITSGGGLWANGVEFRGAPLTTDTVRLIAGNYISGGTAQAIQGAFIAIGRWK